jgi:hypothetical protein
MSAVTTVMNNIKSMLGLGRTDPAQPTAAAQEAQAADAAASSFLASQAKDRAAKLQEVQDKAAQGAVE